MGVSLNMVGSGVGSALALGTIGNANSGGSDGSKSSLTNTGSGIGTTLGSMGYVDSLGLDM